MTISGKTNVDTFDFVQQDEILAQMQAQTLRDFRSAATLAERSSAVVAFSDAAKARQALSLGVRQQQRPSPDERSVFEKMDSSPTWQFEEITATRARWAYEHQGVATPFPD